MVSSDPFLTTLVLGSFGVLLLGLLFTFLRQPSIIGYIIAGVLLGPQVFHVFNEQSFITILGNIGVVLLLFFIGMEVNIKKLLSNWKISVFGTVGQILLSLGVSFILGYYFSWPVGRSLLIGFVISISSTALLIRWLETTNNFNTARGRNVLGILLIQDLAIVPMIIVISLMGSTTPSTLSVALQIIGTILLGVLLYIVFTTKKEIHLPFADKLKKSHDLQLFIAFILCFGLAALTGLFGLSEALGAFVAGIIISRIEGTKWVHDALHSFKIVFVAAFFVSIGLLIDINFFLENIFVVLLLVFVTLLVNTFINAIILRLLKQSWRESIYSGSLLAPIGEFSFVLAATGLVAGVITTYGYQLAIIVIALTLLLSTVWSRLFEYCTDVHYKTKVI